MRLAAIASHPIQYQAPLFRDLAERTDLTVFFAHQATPVDQARAGFGVEFDWDIDLLSGYDHVFLRNVSKTPGLDSFASCDTPEIAYWLVNGCFDAVLTMGWNLKSYIQAIYMAKRLRMPLLARGDSQLQTTREAWKQGAKALAYPFLLRFFDAALFVGERSRAYWTHYHYPRSRMFFSPHCIDAEWFACRATEEGRARLRWQLGIAPSSKVVLFAGKLISIKRPLDLVEAIAHLRAQGQETELLVAGSGPLQKELAEKARTSGIACKMLGFCNQSIMPMVYATADVLVLPSDCETWGLVANEALACGRPIVLSEAVGASPDLAADGSAGRVYPTGNVGALAVALADVLNNPPHASAIAAKSAIYSITAAVDGIMRAADYVNHNQCVAMQ